MTEWRRMLVGSAVAWCATLASTQRTDLALAANQRIIAVDEAAFVRVSVSSAAARPGETTAILVTLITNLDVDALGHELAFEPAARIAADDRGRPDCAVLVRGAEAAPITFLPDGCTPDIDCAAVRVTLLATVVPGLAHATPLYRCAVEVAPDAVFGSYPLRVENLIAGGPDGPQLPGTVSEDGRVVVQDTFPATIAIGSASGRPGEQTSVAVSLETSVDVAGTQNDILFTPTARIAANPSGRPACRLDPQIRLGGNSFAFQPPECDPASDCTIVRALVLSLNNVNPIPDGAVLYTCEIAIAADAGAGSHALDIFNVAAANPDGESIVSTGRSGAVVVEVPTAPPTAVPPATATPPPTRTALVSPTAVATATLTRPEEGRDDDGCAIEPGGDGDAWWLLAPFVVWCLRRGHGRAKARRYTS